MHSEQCSLFTIHAKRGRLKTKKQGTVLTVPQIKAETPGIKPTVRSRPDPTVQYNYNKRADSYS